MTGATCVALTTESTEWHQIQILAKNVQPCLLSFWIRLDELMLCGSKKVQTFDAAGTHVVVHGAVPAQANIWWWAGQSMIPSKGEGPQMHSPPACSFAKSGPWKPLPNHACCARTEWLWNDISNDIDGFSFRCFLKVHFTAYQSIDYPKSPLRSKLLTYALPLQTQSWYADHKPIWFPHSMRISVVGWSCPVKGFFTRTAFCPHFWSAAQSESDAHGLPFPSTWRKSHIWLLQRIWSLSPGKRL